MVRSRILIFAGFVCCFCTPSAARATATVIDSSGNRMGWEIVSRLNSAGHFPFTGSIVNRHVNADINIALEYQRWGLFLFKSHDLEQRDSPVNYFQPGVFRSISITPDIDVRFFFGYVFSQASSFRDPDSDFYAAPVLYWNIGSGFKLENCALFFDLSSVAKLANRVKMVWTTGSVSLEAFVWHRWVIRQDRHATSASLAFGLPPLRFSKSAELVLSLSYQGYVTRAKPDFARRDGFLVNLALALRG